MTPGKEKGPGWVLHNSLGLTGLAPLFLGALQGDSMGSDLWGGPDLTARRALLTPVCLSQVIHLPALHRHREGSQTGIEATFTGAWAQGKEQSQAWLRLHNLSANKHGQKCESQMVPLLQLERGLGQGLGTEHSVGTLLPSQLQTHAQEVCQHSGQPRTPIGLSYIHTHARL